MLKSKNTEPENRLDTGLGLIVELIGSKGVN